MIVRRTLTWTRMLGYLGRPLAVHTAVAVAVVLAHRAYGQRWISVPDLPVSILAAALGILLGFRNNSGYDRWWEARTLWGGIVNTSRRLARQVLSLLPAARERSDDDPLGDEGLYAADEGRRVSPLLASAYTDTFAVPARGSGDGAVRDRLGRAGGVSPAGAAATAAAVLPLPDEEDGLESCAFPGASREARELVYAQIGFVNALRCHLRRQDPLPEIAPYFRPAVLEALRDEQNVPTAILVWMASRLRRAFGRAPGTESTMRLVALDETLNELTNLLGGCERIKNTPIPRQYDFLPRVMVRVYLFLLPLSVVAELGLATPLVTVVIAFLFLSLDAIGRNVEAPFENDIHDTPMTALCRTIEINLRQMLGERTLPPPVQPVDGYLY
ncbi:bestrophin family ion channel [Roseisolibacter sp. H3M3-2]|uniref:bestrophin family protein n=1 Tax=Roseisolibacter sp. H3M3-2 TaxID=3031323 RepID=UPI0023DA2DCC|nr:bestrophin family ion channel [Roseisolibacter sp. H3M3-2]MDF1503417.1 bestrophin family ion channel [Roseisolibacter sp. H3M3-2]